jgi:teichuronic acid biosynthesis glycosyltransferase TuaG
LEKVSVIMPCYNSAQYLVPSVRSVLAQHYRNIELICVDDNSSDETKQVLEHLSISDNRIMVLSNPNRGVAMARNCGIEHASGRYIAFLDSDDLWLPSKLQSQIAFMKRIGAALCHTSFVRIIQTKDEGVIRRCAAKEDFQSMVRNNGMGCSTVIYDVKKLGKVYMPNIKKRQDWATWLSILSKYPDMISFGLDEVLTQYKVREGSISSSKVDLVFYTFLVYRSISFSIFGSLVRTIIYSYKKVKKVI